MGKCGSKLTAEELHQFHLDTNLSHAKIQHCYRNFMEHFEGQLTLEEFQNAYQVYFPDGHASEFAAHLFRSLDTNCDGFVDFEEFICGLGILLKGEEKERMKLAFRIYDIDGDGYISRKELIELLQALFEVAFAPFNLAHPKVRSPDDDDMIPEKLSDQLFYALDKNSDEKISLDEFIEGNKNYSFFLQMVPKIPCSNMFKCAKKLR